MASIGRSCRWTAWTLLIALGACGDNITTSTDPRISTPSASNPAPNLSGVAAIPATLALTTSLGRGDLHLPPGFSPPAGLGYSLVLKGEKFPPDWAGTAYIRGIFLDGTELELGSGSGRGPDGSYLMIFAADCPSRLREAWAFIMSKGRKFESKHIVPAC